MSLIACRSLLFILLTLISILTGWGQPVSLVVDPALDDPSRYGIERLERALLDKGFSPQRVSSINSASSHFLILAGLSFTPSPAHDWLRVLNVKLPQESEALVVQKATIHGKQAVILWGSDARGLMYAALDTADRIGWTDGVEEPFQFVHNTIETPAVKERAVSMYTMHRRYFEDRLSGEKHWKRYFDMLAKSRINSFVMVFGYENGGFMAPAYPYFFDVEGFPDVELYGLTPEQQKRNVEAFKTMIHIAHERGILFRAALWDHIYRGGVQGGGIPGASDLAGQRVPHLVYGVNSENLIAYNKAALRKFLDVFPEVDALQFRMHGESGLKRDEMDDFWHDIFTMIREKKPNMHVDIRAKELPDSVIDDGLSQGLNLRVATKYWMEQMGLPFHPTHINKQNQDDRRHGYADLLAYPQKFPVHWRLWNGGTTRFLLWGDPEYVQRFVESTKIYNGDSFEVNEMLATKMLGEPHDAEPFDLLKPEYQYYQDEIERYWHYYQVWGRVGYDPEVSPEIWEKEFIQRFGKEAGVALMHGLHAASDVLPRIVASSYPYRYFPTTRGWAEMMRMLDLPEFAKAEGSDIQQFQNFQDYAKDILNGKQTPMCTPQENSQWFQRKAHQILSFVEKAQTSTRDSKSNELISTVTDLNVLAHLALYHAQRIPAAVLYNLYKETGDLFSLDKAIAQEEIAVDAWNHVVQAAGDVYSDKMVFGVHAAGFPYHWKEELQRLREGLQKLHGEREQAVEKLSEHQQFLAHIPVRKLTPGEDLVLQITATGLTDTGGMIALVNGKEYPLEGHGYKYETRIEELEENEGISYYFKIKGNQGDIYYPGGNDPEPITIMRTDDMTPPRVNLERTQRARPHEDIKVTAHVTDSSGVQWVNLRYRHLTQFEDYQSVEMKLDEKTGLYSAAIPGEFIIPKWDIMYFIEVMDNQGNGRMYPDLDEELPYVIVEMSR